jgi:hypothetical protein
MCRFTLKSGVRSAQRRDSGQESASEGFAFLGQSSTLIVDEPDAAFLTLPTGLAGRTWGFFRAEAARRDAEAAQKAEEEHANNERLARNQADAEKGRAEKTEEQTLEDFEPTTDGTIRQLIGSKPELVQKTQAYLERKLQRWKAVAQHRPPPVQAY